MWGNSPIHRRATGGYTQRRRVAACSRRLSWLPICRIAELYSAERRVGPTPRRFSTFDNVQLYGTATVQRSRNPIVLVLLLVLDCPIYDDENEDDDDDEKFAWSMTIWTDTDSTVPPVTV